MARDYFQDIVPPNESERSTDIPVRRQHEVDEPYGEAGRERAGSDAKERSIRNISVPMRQRRSTPNPIEERDTASLRGSMPGYVGQYRSYSRWIIWGAAVLSVIVLGVLGLFAFRATTVTVVPRSHPVVFDQTSQFIAYPTTSAASGTLAYKVLTSDVDDSDVVQSNGTEHVDKKASGTVTVVNEYSASSVRLVKNTRFQSAGGLIFRVPAEVIVPGKRGATGGRITVSVVADQSGNQYNLGPTRFTIPGLKSSPDMYAHVYAQSASAMSGGASGDQPSVAPGDLSAAIAAVRGRLEQKIRDAIAKQAISGSVVFPDLVRITYLDLPNQTQPDGKVRVGERAHIEIPVFPADVFGRMIAQSVSADAEGASVRIIGGTNYAAHASGAATSTLGTSPLPFSLTGNALLVWDVDAKALAAALAGKDQGAFQTIVTGFTGVQEAHARIEPFWRNSFPTDPSKIKVVISAPQTTP